MTLTVQITIITLGVILIIVVLRAATQKKITESHALMWMFPCILIILGGIFPQLTWYLSRFFNTEYPPAIIFALAIIMLYTILFQDFKVLSVLTLKNKELASHVALLTARIEKLEQELEAATQEITMTERTEPDMADTMTESFAAATQESTYITAENPAAALKNISMTNESLVSATKMTENKTGQKNHCHMKGE